ncbi:MULTISPECIES: alpha/beta fold hydrolase [Aliiglaciecola]|uniref:alpha/beta fold hydrolase n=1 Tax=Aliiglaciecola TaxID=1406885 RepID=UPI002091568E|nr:MULTISPECIES: alpha/beta hydrolase [Aliiglaciecola]MDO6712603.1 alpha/beta hydrolase [Aliiglaciecola sp. 2_MG-2023]MDO6753789.1 alpha/beta hydrolase [Aliiglaciecola sp. 1_MG-2023]
MSEVTNSEELFADVNGITLCYQTFGNPKDKPLLLIMGLATQMIHWDPRFCQKLVDQGYWVIRFDNRDIGRSTLLQGQKKPTIFSVAANQLFGKKLHVPYDLHTMAGDAVALLDHLNIATCHLVGVSMGGMIAQCIAIDYPNRVASLTSIMSTTGNRTLPKPKKSVMLKIIQPPPKDPKAYLHYSLKLWKMLNGDYFNFDKKKIATLMQHARERSFNPDGVWRQTCAILASPDRTSALHKIKLPSLVIHGDCDPLVPVECGIATAAAIENCELVIIKGMGHTLPEEAWDQIISSIAKLAN